MAPGSGEAGAWAPGTVGVGAAGDGPLVGTAGTPGGAGGAGGRGLVAGGAGGAGVVGCVVAGWVVGVVVEAPAARGEATAIAGQQAPVATTARMAAAARVRAPTRVAVG